MPRSKHRRKGKARPRVPRPPSTLPSDIGAGDLLIGDIRDDDERDAEEDDLAGLAWQQVMDEMEEQFGDELDDADYGFVYDPMIDPDPAAWLALDEAIQYAVVEEAHRDIDTGEGGPRIHAIGHALVETGIASNEPPEVRATSRRLQAEGLDRHEAVHAIAGVLLWHLRQMLDQGIDDKSRSDRLYARALADLTAESWHRDFGPEPEE